MNLGAFVAVEADDGLETPADGRDREPGGGP
jgi:hypothetical protein